jgi:hypothetical protein
MIFKQNGREFRIRLQTSENFQKNIKSGSAALGYPKRKKLLAELKAIPFVGLTTPSERGHSPVGL